MEVKQVAVIKKSDNKWCIFSESGKKLGCYDSKSKAIERLRQIEYFKRSKGQSYFNFAFENDELSGDLLEFDDKSYLYFENDEIYEGKLVDDLTIEIARLSEQELEKIPKAYWVVDNLYSTDAWYMDSDKLTYVKSKDYDHSHIVVVDDSGNGFTTFDWSYRDGGSKNNHRHEVKNWEIFQADSHIHYIRGLTDDFTSQANSFEVFSSKDINDILVFDNMIGVDSDNSTKAKKIFMELIDLKGNKRIDADIKRKVVK